jgi:hypothetical protein
MAFAAGGLLPARSSDDALSGEGPWDGAEYDGVHVLGERDRPHIVDGRRTGLEQTCEQGSSGAQDQLGAVGFEYPVGFEFEAFALGQIGVVRAWESA